jgi:hypothetical protein
MESSKFDALTKALATSTSRRQALKTLAATTFGGILALSGIGQVFAENTCKPPCLAGQKCCGGKCLDTNKDPNHCGDCNVVCKSGLCVNGLCCPPGAVKCGNSCCSFTCCGSNTCVNTQTDVKNCGACGNVCGNNQTCKNGQCVNNCVQLSNGTCVTPCSPSGTNCPCGECICNTHDRTVLYCHNNSIGGDCTSDSQCPEGSFCSCVGFCIGAC